MFAPIHGLLLNGKEHMQESRRVRGPLYAESWIVAVPHQVILDPVAYWGFPSRLWGAADTNGFRAVHDTGSFLCSAGDPEERR